MLQMKKREHDQLAVENFIASLDTTIPMVYHFKNCMRDAMLYKWKSSVVVAIMSGIEEAYKKKEK